jgi:cytoskeletal protein CcmA (bactofilin family)
MLGRALQVADFCRVSVLRFLRYGPLECCYSRQPGSSRKRGRSQTNRTHFPSGFFDEAKLMETPKPSDNGLPEATLIGQSLTIKGELSGSEDLYIDGRVEGVIELKDNRLIVGRSGQVRARIIVATAVVHGRVEGNIYASDRIHLRQSAVIIGDIATQRLSIEEGAYFEGRVGIKKDVRKAELLGIGALFPK